MELRHYWQILRNAWWIVFGLPLVAAAITIALAMSLPTTYVASTAMLITQHPLATNEERITLPDQNSRESWTASEFVADDVLQLVQSEVFARDISAWIATEHQVTVDPGLIRGGIQSDRKHRTIFLQATAPTHDQAMWIAQGAVKMMQDKGLCYWNRCDTGMQLDVSVITPPDSASPAKSTTGLVLDVVLRSILALLLGVGIAFLLHYLDQYLRRASDLEALGFEVVGLIPVERQRKS